MTNAHRNYNWIKKFAFFSVLSIIFFSQGCKKDTTVPESDFQYLIQYEKVTSLSKFYITTFYLFQSAEYPEIEQLVENTLYDVDVYRIEYKTSYIDSGISASGVICIPVASEVFPILSFQNGTNTSHSNAPSIAIVNPYFTLLQSLAGNGYILLIPDYIGFGSSENIIHPYYQKETNNSAIIDMIYATREMLDNYNGGATYSTTEYLMGYSQGGWATLSALREIEMNQTVDIIVKAASSGSGAYSLIDVTNDIIQKDSFPGPLYLPYYVYSHQQYETLHDPLGTFFREPYVSLIPDLFSSNYTNNEVNMQLTNSIADLLTQNLIENFNTSNDFLELRNDLEHNSVEAWKLNSLLRLYHGNADENVPFNQSVSMYNDLISAGNEENIVSFFEMEGLNHETAIIPWGINTILWFNELKSNE